MRSAALGCSTLGSGGVRCPGSRCDNAEIPCVRRLFRGDVILWCTTSESSMSYHELLIAVGNCYQLNGDTTDRTDVSLLSSVEDPWRVVL